MNKEEYLAFHRACCDRMIEITAVKNADYTGNNPSPFSNFTRVEQSGICSTEQGFLVRLNDKFSRIISFMQKGELLVKDESVEDTVLDAANYLILLAGYLKSKRDEEERSKIIENIQGNNTVKLSKEEYEKLLNNQVGKYQNTDDVSNMKAFLEREVVNSKHQVAYNLPNDDLAKPFPYEQKVTPITEEASVHKLS